MWFKQTIATCWLLTYGLIRTQLSTLDQQFKQIDDGVMEVRISIKLSAGINCHQSKLPVMVSVFGLSTTQATYPNKHHGQ